MVGKQCVLVEGEKKIQLAFKINFESQILALRRKFWPHYAKLYNKAGVISFLHSLSIHGWKTMCLGTKEKKLNPADT